MIRFKSISKKYPNGLTWADYHYQDIAAETWHRGMVKLIELITADSREGWRLIFSNLLSSLKASVFYPVMTSFSDWESDYSIGDPIIKFHPQMAAITHFYDADISKGKEAGERIYPQRVGRGVDGYLATNFPEWKGTPKTLCSKCSIALHH